MARFAIDTVIKAVDKVTRPMRRMTRSVTRAASTMGRAFIKLNKLAFKLGRTLLNAGAKFGALGGAGAVTGIALLNKATVEAQQLAKATGLSVENLEAFTAAIKPAGFNLDNVNDLAEEMNNKFGEIATVGAPKNLQEGLKALNLNARELNKLEPDVRFRKIADAILEMENQTVALSAADKIFGGEANKVFGVLRDQAETTDELIKNYRELNFLTGEGRQGAKTFTDSLNGVLVMVKSLAQEVAGLSGEALTPLIKQFGEWLKQNKALVATKVEQFVGRLADGVERFIKFLSDPTVKKEFAAFFNGFQQMAPSLESTIKSLDVILGVVGDIFGLLKSVGTFLGETTAKAVIGAQKIGSAIPGSVASSPMAFAATPNMGFGFGAAMPVVSSGPIGSTEVSGEIKVSASPGTTAEVARGAPLLKVENTGAFE